jgi:MtrB/PioB family decaheme-associated outer membrane protein
MKNCTERFALRATVLAVQGALIGMFAVPTLALAEGVVNEEIAELTIPQSVVEIGANYESKGSDKHGEYTGLNQAGTTAVGNISLRGGDAYGEGGGTGTKRWSITGNDLGTTSRSLNGAMSDQGNWNIGANYDELRHYSTESYTTPLSGSMGGNNFTLPTSFGIVQTNVNTTTRPGFAGTQTLTGLQKTFFQSQDVYSGRQNTSFTAGYNFNREWGFQFELGELKQTGSKLMMASSDSNQSWATVAANNTTTLKKSSGVTAGAYYTVEAMMMLMNPTNYTTDTANLALNWTGDKGHFSVGYFGSLFRDGYNSVSWQTPMVGCSTASAPNVACTLGAGNATGTVPASAFPTNILSTAPSNEFHQLNFSGGYAFTPKTKVAGSLSYGRNTQNDDFVNDPNQMQANGLLPQNSLNGLVISQHADLKLTDQTTRDMTLSAGIKYNLRDNKTAANVYNFIDLGDKTRTSVSTPMSNAKTQLELAGDFRINKQQNIRVAYERENIRRWCNDPLSDTATAAAKSVAAAGYYTVNSCVQIPVSNEDKLGVNYRLKTTEDIGFNAGYSYATRKAEVNASFYNPMQSNSEGFEALGYRAFFDASRDEHIVKVGVDWQANEKLNVTVGGKYAYDLYTDSALGVQSGYKGSANVDATYSYSDTLTMSAYATFERRFRTLTNASTVSAVGASSNMWTNDLADAENTIGVNFKQKGLMGGKLTLVGDLTYSIGNTLYTTAQPYSTTCANAAAAGPTCGSLPSISNEMWELKISGHYQVNKASKIRVGYAYQQLTSNDYYYNAYQTGYTPTSLMPTDQQSPSYSVNAVFAAYVYTF